MSREIEFRGKRCADGVWVYGDYVAGDSCDVSFIFPRDITSLFCVSGHYEVYENTIGEFAGITDKNGVKIYEGDIVKWGIDQKMYVVEFRNGMFYAIVEECNPYVYGGFPLWHLCKQEQHCTIVGNIYDNPELLSIKEKQIQIV